LQKSDYYEYVISTNPKAKNRAQSTANSYNLFHFDTLNNWQRSNNVAEAKQIHLLTP